MPAEIQKGMDYTLFGLKNTLGFLDDILIVIKDSVEDLFVIVTNCNKFVKNRHR